ncbi:hypothetical protein [Rickettsiales endosymbiont of Trichoplax sp. H2]|uniref:hypothetical protein n=1 Tax=Rickettsiales endosymbiont of Trichoplax sp. H2 TaxID=2021221 RepID=UPI0012B1F808|nr:hypothetical protein [Rickettsiales endosymbiont of Trichoplax sp. H2]MSO14615.1 hypothetical protein [Rickettsiales endosymbiont of Trichoplax sp. H2]
MPTLPVRLPDEVLNEVSSKASTLHLSKNAYIHKAIDKFNKEIKINNKIKREKITKASQKICTNSMEVNSEFSIIENYTDL